ncbi:hypothetical protein BLS_005685 [Venturia inaequalis]|uniref:C2H2-type domain-containing protein n=1 Tax=Venturia inaequalis TaxID=5025 RepID=A0A8H3Z564_VENIN|nr:hypothetical protein BLS_005685 [Venturia inaequalis]
MDCFAALTTAALVVDLFKIVKLATKQLRALTLSVKDAHRLRTFWNAEELLSKLEVDLAELQQAIRPEGDLPVSTSADVAVQLRSVAHERMEFWSSRFEEPNGILKDFSTPPIRFPNQILSSPLDPWSDSQLDGCFHSSDGLVYFGSGHKSWCDTSSRSDAIEAVVDQSLTAERAAMESCAAAKAALQSCKAAAQSCTPTQQLSEHESWEHSSSDFLNSKSFFAHEEQKRNLRRHMEASHSLSRFECETCHASYNRVDNLTHHARKHHPEHFWQPGKRRRATDDAQLVCAECRLPFQSLEAHAKAVNHRAFSCAFENCVSSFGRRDLLLRHELTHTDETNYPCPHCDKYSGKNGFKRKDHLQQHLSNFHNKELYPEFCNHTDCKVKAIAVSQKAFKSMKEYRAHLREVHDQTPFPCDWPGCERKGGKGYSRERDLEAHKKTHQQAITPLYTPSENGQNRGLNEKETSWLTGMGGSLDSQFIWNGPEDQSAALSAQRFNEDCEQIMLDNFSWDFLGDSPPSLDSIVELH